MSFSRLLVIFALMLALVGQGVSSLAMACHMPNGEMMHSMSMQHDAMTADAMQHGDMDHSMMDMSADSDCCDTDCKCPASACTSYSFVSTPLVVASSPIHSEKFEVVAFAQLQANQSSLYRPPISA